MGRTIVYPARYKPPRPGEVEVHSGAPDDKPDTYEEKLLKYIPAEVLSGFLLLSAAARETTLLPLVLVAGLAATPGYLFMHALQEEEAKRPRWYFYALATLAFIVWALAASESVRELTHVSALYAEILLGLAVLLIPLADQAFTNVFKR